MPWVRIDDQFPEHPKVAAAGPLAMAMQVAGLCYCNRKLTDGYIPRGIARTLLDWQFVLDDKVYEVAVTCGFSGDDVSCDTVIELLLEADMWRPVPGGYEIVNYLEYQPSRADVEKERAAARDRMSKRRSGGTSGDVRANDERSSSSPNPKPNPKNSSSSSDIVQQGDGEPVDDERVEEVLQAIADLQTSRAKDVSTPKAYRAKCLRNARLEHAAEVRRLLAVYEAPASLLAAAVAFGETRNLGMYRRPA